MKIIFIADLHIKLGQKNVPKKWQYNRTMLLAKEINKISDADYIVIGGDLLDVAKPSLEEVGLMYDFLEHLDLGGYIIPGNHEMLTKTMDCFTPVDKMLYDLGFDLIREFKTIDNIDYIPYNIIKKDFPAAISKMAITHVRGEIPPHVFPEVDLSKYEAYESVFAGDLHSYKCSQLNLLYPGSPFTTSFHRDRSTRDNGCFIIDTDTGCYEWIELYLPQLIKTTVTSEEQIVATEVDHTVYEIEGNLEELAKVNASDLLSKKITKNISSPSTLDMSGDVVEELAGYLEKIKKIEADKIPEYLDLFRSVIPND
jgi:DNA repair exonuclease SbcCD nuclease subunit